MTLCTLCNKHYWEHDEKDLIACNKQKDLNYLQYRFYVLTTEEMKRSKPGNPKF